MVADVVEIEKLANFSKAEAGPFAAQYPGDTGAVALRIEPLSAAPLGGDQTFILVKAQRPRGDSEGIAHLADRIRRLRAGDWGVLHQRRLLYVSVKVNTGAHRQNRPLGCWRRRRRRLDRRAA